MIKGSKSGGVGGKEVLLSVYSESQAAASCLRPLFLPLFTAVPMATAPPSPECLELGPGVFWLRSKSFSLRLPRASGDLTATRPRQARPGQAGPGQAGLSQARLSGEHGGFGVAEAEGERREGRGERRDPNLGVGRQRVGEGGKPRALHHCWSEVRKGRI